MRRSGETDTACSAMSYCTPKMVCDRRGCLNLSRFSWKPSTARADRKMRIEERMDAASPRKRKSSMNTEALPPLWWM